MPNIFTKTIGYIVTILIAIFLIYSIFNYQEVEFLITRELATYGLFALFVFTVILEFAPQPFSAQILLATAIFIGTPFWLALIIVLIASLLGSTLGFAVGRYYGSAVVKHWVKQKTMLKTEKLMNSHGRWFVFFSAFTPLPFIPLVFGALHFSKKNFLYFGLIPSLLGYIVETILLVAVL